MENTEYTISDEEPKEGDYTINLQSKKNKPRLVQVCSSENNTLGYHQPDSWFKWSPLRKHHKKVIFKT